MRERTPIQIPPGVFRQGSEAEMAGKWYETQLVRWVEGVLRPIDGWEKIVLSQPVASTIRNVYVWTDQDGITRTALLCEAHLYVLEGNELLDISPVPPLTAPSANLLEGGYGDDIYYGATRIDPPDPPGTPVAPIWIDPDGYGMPRPPRLARKSIDDAYSLSNWGEDLLAMTSVDGRLLRWKPSDPPGTVAQVVPNAPLANRQFVVTPERHVLLFQLGGEFNAFGWCDQEDIENWAFTDVTKMAGRYNVEPAGPIIAAITTRAGTLFFTPHGAYIVRYIGLPYVYSYELLGRYAAPMTNAALVRMLDAVAWPAPDGFWNFDGSTISPVNCPLLDWLQRVANPRFAPLRMSGLFLGSQTEAWWFFPSHDATENDRYLVWNFQENWWAMGRLTRTCGVSGTAINYPLMSDGQQLFRHEFGRFYYDAPELPFAQSGAINIAAGDRLATVTRAVADTRAPANDVQFWIEARQHRIMNGTPPNRLKGPYRVRADGKLDFRATGRDLIIRIESTLSGVEPWTFGQMLVKLNPRGQR